MKKFYSFVLLAATLLLSTNIYAQNVAKVGTTEYATIAAAISDWTSNGGTLTLLSDGEYNATATVTIAKDATLDLNGQTLTWKVDGKAINAITISGGSLTIKDDTKAGKLSFLFTEMTKGQYGIYQGTAASKCTIENATIACDVRCANSLTGTITPGAIQINAGSISVSNSSILMHNNCAQGIRLSAKGITSSFSHITIKHTGSDENETLHANYYYGLYTSSAANSITLNDEGNLIDLSNAPTTYINSEGKEDKAGQYALNFYASTSKNKCTITISAGTYKVNTTDKVSYGYALKAPGNSYHTISVSGGIFIGKEKVSLAESKNNNNYYYTNCVISGGIFNVEPDSKSLKTDYVAQKMESGDYAGYYQVESGNSVLSVDGQEYATEADGWAKCSKTAGTYSAVKLLANQSYTIPSGMYVAIEKENTQEISSITNNGNLKIEKDGSWNCTFTNNGSLSISKGTFGDNFVLTNAGSVSVLGGVFSATALKQIKEGEKNYIANGYDAYVQMDGTYRVANTDGIIAEVNGIQFSGLEAALRASSVEHPAKLLKDFTTSQITLTDVQAMYLDMNGKTLTFKAGGAGSTGFVFENGKLTIQGIGTIIGNCEIMFKPKGSTDATVNNHTVLTIGDQVTLKHNYTDGYGVGVNDANRHYGVVVNFNGTYEGANSSAFYINGDYTAIGNNTTTFNIGSTAKITARSLAYAAGYGIWNYEGTATTENFGFEIRAGKFTMNGGSIICTADKPADDQYNGNGSTSQACGIAVCQHNTKLPIDVVVNDGEIKAYTPLYQANPQNNETDMSAINLTVNGGKFFSTSQNIVWSLNKRITLNGGVYNLSPAAYVASDKAVVDNTDADTKAQYPYAIGAKATAMTTVKAGAWNDAATWSAEAGATAIPTAATPVVIKHAVTIPAATKAQTDGITVEGGNITVEGALIVGNAGITGITAADQLLIKDGASMVISPAAPAANSQPLATVELKTVIRDVKNEYQAGDRTYEYIWQNIGVPVTPMTITPAKTLTVNTWDIVSAWVPATEFGTPFLGYHVTNVDNKTAGMIYTFAGKLVGPQNAALSMPRDGFHFFGNSWTAPFDVKEILNQLQSKSASDDINSAVYVYISDKLTVDKVTYNDGQYVDINLAKLEDAATAEAFGQIAALQGFFLHSDAKADIALNYEKAVWNAALAKPQPTKKPASMMEEENTAVRLILTAENGRSDVLYLYEGEAYAAPKMMNTKPNVNIYAITADGNYSTMGVDKIEGSKIGIQTNAKTNYTISFDWLKGETLYLKDKTANKYVAMLEDATYSFMAEANATIDDRFEIVGKSDVPGTGTAVEDVNVDVEATGIYTLMGQYVGETSMWNTLPAGMYIVNGKKCVK